MSLDIQHLMRAGTLSLPSLPPLSVYVHLPWCLKKCPYCDFNSHEMRQAELPEQAYLDAVCADIEASLPLVWGRQVHIQRQRRQRGQRQGTCPHQMLNIQLHENQRDCINANMALAAWPR